MSIERTTHVRKIDKKLKAYWQSLGRFIHQFSSVEQTVQLALWHYAKVSDDIGRAAFSGVRIDGAVTLIRRIAQVDDEASLALVILDPVFDQLIAINAIRNDIVHYGSHASGATDGFVSNAAFALTEAHIRETIISVELLEALSFDLSKINGHLAAMLWPNDPDRRNWSWYLKSPWQYKRPSSPSRDRHKSKDARKR